jgi:acetoin utilization deacetylase AcuC-like enzyme
VRLVHTPEYVRKLRTGTLSPEEEAQLEVPYSEALVNAFWMAAGGSIAAARMAMKDGVAINIGGGFHHAFPNHGEGFCMINDIAVAIRRLKHDGKIVRAMTVDCDVHQGNGTAFIFGSARQKLGMLPPPPPPIRTASGAYMTETPAAKDVFTISLHQEHNYPYTKPQSSIDVNLPDGCGDEEYLEWLDQALSSGLRQFDPELICYVAGADPFREDQLGGLNLTVDGLKQRDELVFRTARARSIPVMVTYAGGYANHVEDTVAIHCNTVTAAVEVYKSAVKVS